jgi:uncharacterized protein
MVGDVIVADATVHAYNWSEENYAIPIASMTTAAGVGFHGWLTTDEASKLTEAEFRRNWLAKELEQALFFESPVDIAAHHGTPIWDYYKDGHSDTNKGIELRELQPDRTIVYGAVNPFHGERCLRDVERLVKEHNVDGIKVYAARYDQGKTYEQRLDDPEFGYPFIEKCLELGVRVIATHKAVPFGPVRSEAYNVRDLPEVCAVFPEMNFEIVHAGFAFVEDTAFLAGFPNVWLNLEFSAALVTKAPRRVAEFVGHFATMGGADRILFSTTCTLLHPKFVIEEFMKLEMPEDLIEGFGYPEITPELMRGFMGENYLRLHQIDPNEFRARVADDAVSRAQAGELPAPWSHLRGEA